MDANLEKRTAKSVFLRYPWLKRTVAGVLAGVMLISVIVLNGQVAQVGESAQTVQREPAQTTQQPQQVTTATESQREEIRVIAPWDSEVLAARMAAREEQTSTEEEISVFALTLGVANTAMDEGDYELALEYALQCLDLAATPDETASAQALLGNVHFTLEDYTSALACYEAVRALEQDVFPDPALCSMVARCRMLLGDYAGVLTACEEGLAGIGAEEDDALTAADLYVLSATAYLYQSEYARARDAFEQALAHGYEDADTLREQIALCDQILAGTAGTSGSGAAVMDDASYAALSYYAAGQYAQAATAYEALYAAGGSYYTPAQLCSCIAKCRLLLAEYEAALTWSQTGLDLGDASERATLYSLRGTAYMALGQNLQAAQDYDAAIAGGYADAVTLNSQSAACYYFAELYDDAVRCGLAAVEGGATEAALWLALSQYMIADYPAAAESLRISLSFEQSYCDRSELCRLLTRSSLLAGDFDGAVSAADDGLAALVDEGSTDSATLAEFYALRGAAYQSAGSYQTALDDFQTALAIGYVSPFELQKQSVLCAFLLAEYDQAVEYAHAAYETGNMTYPGEPAPVDPNDPEAQPAAPDGELSYWLGLSEFSRENYDVAAAAFTQSIESENPQDNLYFYLGVCRFSVGAYDEAIASFTESIARGETTERCIYNRGLCYLQTSEYDAARTDLESAAEQQTDPDVASEAAALLESLRSVLY